MGSQSELAPEQLRPPEWCTDRPVDGRGVRTQDGLRVILRETYQVDSMENYAMAAKPSIDPARFLHDQVASASPDLLRSLLIIFVDALMSAEADAVCGAAALGTAPQPGDRPARQRRGGQPFLLAPAAAGEDLLRCGADGSDRHQRLVRIQPGGLQRGDVPVATVLKEHADRMPQGQV